MADQRDGVIIMMGFTGAGKSFFLDKIKGLSAGQDRLCSSGKIIIRRVAIGVLADLFPRDCDM